MELEVVPGYILQSLPPVPLKGTMTSTGDQVAKYFSLSRTFSFKSAQGLRERLAFPVRFQSLLRRLYLAELNPVTPQNKLMGPTGQSYCLWWVQMHGVGQWRDALPLVSLAAETSGTPHCLLLLRQCNGCDQPLP